MPSFHLLSLLILSTSTLSPLILTLTLTHPSPPPNSPTLDPRKEVSHNIRCHADALPPATRWPPHPAAPRETYDSLEQLCRFDRTRPNVGCLCDVPYVQVECRRELADPSLYAAFLSDCAHDCYCLHSTVNWMDTSIAAAEARGRWPIVPFTGGQRSDPGQAAQARQRAGGGGGGSFSE